MDIKFSDLLSTIINHIPYIVAQGGDTVMTAEKLFASALDLMESEDFVRHNKEELLIFTSLLDTLKEDGFSRDQTKQKLLACVHTKQSKMALADSLYIQKKINEAKAAAMKENAPVLSFGTLCSSIIVDPSESLYSCLYGKSENGLAPADTVKSITSPANVNEPQQKSEEKALTSAEAKLLMTEITNKVRDTRSTLMKSIYGQDNAIGIFTTGYFQAELLSVTDKLRTRPRATFLFAGPPGVGKTFLAEKAAETLKLPFMRFDMSEYSGPEGTAEFCGMSKVWQNAKEGSVTSFAAANPKCVILFDEVEKAHINVIHLFLQLLDAGRLRDSYTEQEVSFTDSIIILTTNAGKQLYGNSEMGDFLNLSRKVILKSLQKDINPINGMPFFPAAICSRFASGNVVMFNHIAAHDLREIAKREVMRQASNFEKEIGIKINIDERVYTSLLFAEGGSADARTVRGRAESFFDNEMFELFRLVPSDAVKTGINDIEQININVELPSGNEELLNLFESKDRQKVLMFASPETAEFCRTNAKSYDIIDAQDISFAAEAMRKNDIRIILIDLSYGRKGEKHYLNVEDTESLGREFLHYVCGLQCESPVYLIQTGEQSFSDEERFSFMRQGVRGVMSVSNISDFSAELENICSCLHQQSSMISLAKSNKVVTFETGQTLSPDGKCAYITLFDFELGVAVDAEDSENILSSISKPNVRFEQVIGADNAINELKYFVDYLKNPKKFIGTGVKSPRGILLYGPPGTGKTMLAKAMASESDVTFITAEGNQFLKKYVGEGPEKVHELFKTARKYAPTILFVDEIDAIGKARTGGESSHANEEVLTAFLAEMDGFSSDPAKPVFVLAATNYNVEGNDERTLDAALVRRFDRKVYIDLPNRDDRIKYMKMKISANEAFQISDEKLDNIAVRSTGRSLAELESVFELALRSAIRVGNLKVTDDVLEEAFETYFSGESKKWDVSQLERVARHEAGHAFICWKSGETPSYITIVARANHGGYMQHDDNEGKAIYTRDELLSKIRTSLGGRAAELVYYGERDGISTGASGDLNSATNMAYQMICTYGMDDDFGLAVIDPRCANSGELSYKINTGVNKILSLELEKAVGIISDNRKAIDALVEELFSKNHLSGKEIEEIFKSNCLTAV